MSTEQEKKDEEAQYLEEMLANDFDEYEKLFAVHHKYKAGEINGEQLTEELFDCGFYNITQEDAEKICNEITLEQNGAVSIFNCIILIKRLVDAGTKQKFQRVVSRKGVGLFRTNQKDKKPPKKKATKDDIKPLAKAINQALADDPDCKDKNRIPIDPESEKDFYDKLKDGVILDKLDNKAKDGVVDPNGICQDQPMKGKDKMNNCKKAVDGAKDAGIKHDCDPEDILDGDKEEVPDLVKKVLKKVYVPTKKLKGKPELNNLKNEGETDDDLENMEPDDLLKRWFNKHLKNANHPDELTNFNDDVKNGDKYTVLLNQLNPDECDKSALDETDPLKKAEKVIENAKKIVDDPIIEPKDIVSGDNDLNTLFTSQLFNAAMNKPAAASPNELKAYVKTLNKLLEDYPTTKDKIPVDPESNEIFDKAQDGIIPYKLATMAENIPKVPMDAALNTIQSEEAVNKGDMDDDKKKENLTKGLEKAKNAGCKADTTPDDYLNKKKPKVENSLKELIDKVLVDRNALGSSPEIEGLKKEGESNDDVLKADSDDLLKRWFNKHLKDANHPNELTNFGDDLKDGEKYTVLLNQLNPDECDKSALDETDPIKKAEKIIENSKTLDIDPVILPEDIVNGNVRINRLFTAQLMNAYASENHDPYDSDERRAYSKLLNKILADDEDCKQKLPINPENNDLFRKSKDGILMCKVLEKTVPGTVDDRVLKKGNNVTAKGALSNANLAVNAAKSIGCVTPVTGKDINSKKKPAVLDFYYQVLKNYILKKINFIDYPQLLRMKKEGEDKSDLLSLLPDDLLIRWFNYHLKNAKYDKELTNLGDDVKDSEKYTILMNQLDGEKCDKSALDDGDLTGRAGKVLDNGEKLGVNKFILPRNICDGNVRLNTLFTGELYNYAHGLGEATEAEKAEAKKLFEDDEEGTREERTFRMWINSLRLDDTKKVNNLYEECRTGILLLKVIDRITPGSVNWKIVETKTKQIFKIGVNCGEVITAAKKAGYSIVNIGGNDIREGNKKAILAIVWQLMRRHTLQIIGDKPEEELIQWANGFVQAEHQVKSLKDKSLGSGLFWIEVLAGISPQSIHWEFVAKNDPSDKDKEMNAKYAISVARELDALIFIVWEDITKVKSNLLLTFLASLYDVYNKLQKKE